MVLWVWYGGVAYDSVFVQEERRKLEEDRMVKEREEEAAKAQVSWPVVHGVWHHVMVM